MKSKDIAQVLFGLLMLVGIFFYEVDAPAGVGESRAASMAATVTPSTWHPVTDESEALPEGRYLPGDHVLAGSQTRANLRRFAATGGQLVIRLNGNTSRDIGAMSIEEEKYFVEEVLGLEFRYFNIEGNVTHSATIIADLMSDYRTLIHCRHGRHRAPTMAAWYLIHQLRHSPADAHRYVGISDIINQAAFSKYFDVIR